MNVETLAADTLLGPELVGRCLETIVPPLRLAAYSSSGQFGQYTSIAPNPIIAEYSTFDAVLAAYRARIGEAPESASVPVEPSPADLAEPCGLPNVRCGKWQAIRRLGEGGQGEVYEAFDIADWPIGSALQEVVTEFDRLIRTGISDPVGRLDAAARLASALVRTSPSTNHRVALKIMRQVGASITSAQARSRMMNEIKSMRSVSHPSLLDVIDASEGEERGIWFVAEFFPLGNLEAHPFRLRGRVLDALMSFRDLVEGVAAIHSRKMVHRDIKPANVFLHQSGRLVLGDFGLVFSSDGSRLTTAGESVGTRDWMPAWAEGERERSPDARFDVYCLGKLLWSLVSGKPYLRREEWDQDEFSLPRLVPYVSNTRFIEEILSVTVHRDKSKVLPDAHALLIQVDRCLKAITRDGRIG